MELELTGPLDCDPLRPLAPDQAPEAVQAVAFVADQLSMAELPALTLLGLACSVTWGACEVTVTVADCEAVPPWPVQVSSNSVLLVNLPLIHVPLTETGPLQPPLAMHCVAWSAFQARLVTPEPVRVVGEALNVISGACWVTVTCRLCVCDAPPFVQVRV